ncbi:hypothetical protein [Kineosporia succinea]|uniref:Uncharacterized protein n=1 Tax=Kineosporia succinea TaxID=84632 RepID=A0ABT9PGL0_9ACTN|nr:hypothetical protein [Kineosporia succinea]MDP9831095.1 hypothetical protein [Kineosporia succinea]
MSVSCIEDAPVASGERHLTAVPGHRARVPSPADAYRATGFDGPETVPALSDRETCRAVSNGCPSREGRIPAEPQGFVSLWAYAQNPYEREEFRATTVPQALRRP